VIGTGGYVCGPVVLAAAINRIPTLIHEQNAYPGITNRLLSRMASCVAVTFADSLKYFPAKTKTTITGLPVRPAVLAADRAQSQKQLGISKEGMLLLSFGGSRGARTINEAMLEVIRKHGGSSRLNVIHITGNQGHKEFLGKAQGEGIDLNAFSNITIMPYMYNIHEALAAADLVVSRAGAATLAELTAVGIPSILVPYPYAAENHQEYNARVLEKEGAALVVLDKELTGELICGYIDDLANDREKLGAMRAAGKNLGREGALRDIIACVKGLAV